MLILLLETFTIMRALYIETLLHQERRMHYLTVVMVTVFTVHTTHTGPRVNKEIMLLSCFLSYRKGLVHCKNRYLPVSMMI